ncbi:MULTISPECIES: thiamine phosphate synthase [unclassified Pedobacter]|uniref:thiamine phosphate synthase n=1 Tax=unclassified Pedobacter TaxID=2628915 RepID=UPI001424A331|nr:MULTISPECIES: thiamine phosphate synthase [unclassified Pedobacter]NII84202.1 thiamine-phosphate pyrophosphorylase [Pedobacter sp. SG908]NMN38882.1 thiamine-phosphate pyrophosphorylase [Pedobacter sp. SG918]
MKYIEKLHYITHDIPHRSHIEQAQLACEAGAKWIQYRCLSKNDEALLQDINAIAEICDDWGTTLIVTDHIHLNGKADIQGFHMEDMDADFIALRKLVGNDITLGGLANTVENLIRLAQEGVDYAGYGPFAITETKPNKYNLLGIEGYQQAVKELKAQSISIPVLAVGGIKTYDVEALMQTGIYGIAVSGAINFADDFIEAYQDFYTLVKEST